MSYYVKLIVLPIKIIPRSLTLFVLLISAFYQHDMSHNNADISKTKRVQRPGSSFNGKNSEFYVI